MPNILSDFLGRVFSMASSLLLTLNMRAWLPFSGVMLIVAFTQSMSVHLSFQASSTRIPVSLSA